MRHMEIAWAQLGVAETPGAAATPEIVQYFADAGHPEVTSDETAWCAALVGACLSRAGIPLTAIPKPERLLAIAYLKIGTELPLDQPRVGAVAVIETSLGYHTGFLTRWTDATITLLGGNQANQVKESNFPRSSLKGLRWPAEEQTASELAAAGVKTIQVADRQQADAAKAGTFTVSQQTVPAPPKGTLSNISDATGALGMVQGLAKQAEAFALFAWAKWPWIAGAIALYYLLRMAWDAGWIKDFRVKAANSGANPARAAAAKEADNGAVV
jgi:uncharacterized protein (TIGR02594 family)